MSWFMFAIEMFASMTMHKINSVEKGFIHIPLFIYWQIFTSAYLFPDIYLYPLIYLLTDLLTYTPTGFNSRCPCHEGLSVNGDNCDNVNMHES